MYKEYRDNIKPKENELHNLITKKTNQKFQYTYKCPSADCRGFLNSKFICDLCDVKVCRKCYIISENDEEHECNQENVDTFEQIKKEAKPCPTCGEFISKISGCDQMFCVTCGSGFSWKTGLVEKGIIHNPHAHAYFENNEEAQNMYNNNLNNQQENGCRAPIPTRTSLKFKFLDEPKEILLLDMWRRLSEFRQYHRANYIRKVETNTDTNQDIRMTFINKQSTEKHFKSVLHARDKKNNYHKQVCNLLISTFEIAEMFLWEIAKFKKIVKQLDINYYSTNDFDKIVLQNNVINKDSEKILDSIFNLIDGTNKNLRNISRNFGYSSSIILTHKFSGYPYNI